MLRYFIFCSIFFIPVSLNPSDIPKSQQLDLGAKNNTSFTSSERNMKQPDTKLDETSRLKVNLSSEGGLIVPDTPHTTLLLNSLELDSETGKNKLKSIAARKGVDPVAFSDMPRSEESKSGNYTTLKNIYKSNFNKSSLQTPTNATNNKTIVDEIGKKSKIPHKPLILSHEALANSNRASNDIKNNDIITNKIHQVTGYKNPDLIMPVIITVLVVPLFAALGYLAVKRGQEAWKNRHYKRMDFLLDGMYND